MAAPNAVVLLGERDQVTSELYQRGLRDTFDVIAASDGATILYMLYTRPVAALVLEPTLFANRWWEHVAAISRLCADRGVPLLICSTLDERRRGLDLGARTYLVKPILPATLLEAVQQLLQDARL